MTSFTNVIDLVSRLQSACTALGDTGSTDASLPSLWDALPSIVVVGGQSSGKSSVLEAVVGRDFLPRGSGIVTKRPLLLRLVRTESNGNSEYGIFQHNPNKKFTDFQEIMDEITAETDRHLQQTRQTVSKEPINLTVYSPDVPNLTLVDLPGLTKVRVEGQSERVIRDLEEMVRAFIEKPNVIILAVTPANADIATSDALWIAKSVDPTGERTIGVFTKIDIMDRGTDVRDELLGRSVPLKMGWVGVVNRSQKDINERISIEKARSSEMDFFRSNELYKDLPNVGVKYLTNKLSECLITAVRKELPNIQNVIETGIKQLQSEMDRIGAPAPLTRGGMIHLIMKILRQFEEQFTDTIDSGKNGGERILYIFEEGLEEKVNKQPFAKLLEVSNVQRIVDQSDGYQPHLIAPEKGYRKLIEEGVALLKQPTDKTVDEVHGILKQLMIEVAGGKTMTELEKYPFLRGEIMRAAEKKLEKMRDESRKMCATLVEMEAVYLTARFFRPSNGVVGQSGKDSLPPAITGDDLMETRPRNLPPEKVHYWDIGKTVSKYLEVVINQIKVTVPKAIVHAQVLKAKKDFLDEYLEQIAGLDEPDLKRLLGEDDAVAVRRRDVANRLALLKKAETEISMAAI
eukprot:TRINITY_DN4402_c0_g1_i1.p1 TRINITY_DN4402_c0_g1~~TRINITY_DN4402_c0_g1_i1.p1  ORF type:complete len:629 (+),score=111.69 TRINITY_DN4402_c0_g1_i1:342-2228(+)